jgi:CBS-domain-containing membrane protein
MAARGSGGLLLCLGLLLTMPALAATPTDRGECAASADKPDFGGAACSRIIDDASERWQNASRPSRTAGRGSFNRKDYDRAIADYGEAIKLSPKDAWAFAHRCEATRAKRTTMRPLRIAPRRSRSIRNMAGPTTTVASPITVCMNTTRAGRPRRGDQGRFQGRVGLCPPRHGVDGKG